GIALYFWCAGEFTFRGGGTHAPIDPPRAMVIKGTYRWTRNPMYVAVLSTILGEAVFFRSAPLATYALLLFGTFHLFVLAYEEPTLQRQFGSAYAQYQHTVPRWLLPWHAYLPNPTDVARPLSPTQAVTLHSPPAQTHEDNV